MSDYRFGDEYRLNIYPNDAIGYDGELDIDKVEAVEIDCVDFIRKPDDKSRWFKLFGTPERTARTLAVGDKHADCGECVIREACRSSDIGCLVEEPDELLEWLRDDV